MENINKLKKALLAGVITLTSIAVLSGCGYSQLRPLPDKERYAKINAIKDELDYKSAGTVKQEKYDNGDGVFSPSYAQIKLQGADTFTTLADRIENLSGVKCFTTISTGYACDVHGISVTLARKTDTSSNVSLKITDSMNGRTDG